MSKLKVIDYTAQNVNRRIVECLRDEIVAKDIDIVDFKGTQILEMVHEDIAKLMVDLGVTLINVPELDDRNTIEYHKKQLIKPEVESIDDYIELFKKRFPEGSICILDRTIVKDMVGNENRLSIIMIKDIFGDRVRIRKYHHSKVQPKYFREAGGKDSSELYIITEINFIDLYNEEISIDYPRTERERFILDTLFSID